MAINRKRYQGAYDRRQFCPLSHERARSRSSFSSRRRSFPACLGLIRATNRPCGDGYPAPVPTVDGCLVRCSHCCLKLTSSDGALQLGAPRRSDVRQVSPAATRAPILDGTIYLSSFPYSAGG